MLKGSLRGCLVPVVAAVALLFGAAAVSPVWAQRLGTRANLSLASSNAAISQSSNTQWKLVKTGVVNASDSTVSWQVSATRF